MTPPNAPTAAERAGEERLVAIRRRLAAWRDSSKEVRIKTSLEALEFYCYAPADVEYLLSALLAAR